MHPSQSILPHQQKRTHHHIARSDCYTFFNLLTAPGFLEKVESLTPEHRERKFPPTETLSMFLAQAMNEDSSCQKVVNDAAMKRLQGGFFLLRYHTLTDIFLSKVWRSVLPGLSSLFQVLPESKER